MKQMTEEEKALTVEALRALLNGGDVEYFDGAVWRPTDNVSNFHPHRPKPQPATRDWSGPDDVPGPVCWISMRNGLKDGMIEQMVVEVISTGVYASRDGKIIFREWEALSNNTYSTDRKTWLPCRVTVTDGQAETGRGE